MRTIFIGILTSIILFILTITVLAEGGWNPDISRKLLELEWQGKKEQDAPLILYALYFKELNSTVSRQLAYKINSESSDNDFELLRIVKDEDVLQFLKNYLVEINNWDEIKKARADCISWMSTVGYNPVRISLREDMVSYDEKTQEKMTLTVFINPVKIDYNKEKILTEFELVYDNLPGQVARISSVNWVEDKFKQPVAVINLKNMRNRTDKNQFLALYLIGTVISTEQLAKLKPLTMGDISVINRVFGSIPDMKKLSDIYGFYLSKDNFLMTSKINYKRHDILGEVVFDREQKTEYKLRFDYCLFNNKQLTLASRIFNISGDKPIIGIGLGDKVSLSKRFSLKVNYYPLIYQLDEEDKYLSSMTELNLNFNDSSWHISYKGEYLEESYSESIGLTYRFTPVVGVSSLYRIDHEETESLFLGIEFWH